MTEDSPTITTKIPLNKDVMDTNKFKKSTSTKTFNLKSSSSKLDLNLSKNKIAKGPTRMTQTGSQKVMESYKWEEMNIAIDNHRDMIYKQKSEIVILRDKLDEKDHIIMRLMEQLQSDEAFMNRQGEGDEEDQGEGKWELGNANRFIYSD